MAESDWTALTSGLGASDVARGVSQGYTPPNGGGSFVFGFHSLTNNAGAAGYYPNDSNFAPAAKGGSIAAALQRTGGDHKSTVLIACALDGTSINAEGYLLGFADDEEPAHLILRKGKLSEGLPETDYLRKSTSTYAKGTWAHVRLDVIVQPHGDVHLQVFENDLGTYTVSSPTWAAIDGMAEYIDDAIGYLSGSPPYASGGYFAKAFLTEEIGRVGLIDFVTVGRQL